MRDPICGYRDDPRMWGQSLTDERRDIERAEQVEAYTDELMADCRVFTKAKAVYFENDLHDGDFLPKLMTEICKWDGSSLNAAVQMKALFNLLADEFQQIAEREIK